MAYSLKETVEVVQAKWEILRGLRREQVQAQHRLEALTQLTMEAARVYDEAVEEMARVAREGADEPSPLRRAAEAMIATEKGSKPAGPPLNPWGRWCGDCQTFHPVDTGETVDHTEKAKPYGYGLDDEPDGE